MGREPAPEVPIRQLGRRGAAATECAFFGEDARFHHIGLALPSIHVANPGCEPVAAEEQKVSIAFIQLNGITIELLEPLADDSPIAKSLRQGVKLLHLCFEVPNLDQALELGRSAGFHRLSGPSPAPFYENRRVAWVFSKHYGLFELLEQDRISSSPEPR
ncbi:MAG: VOC family protein [Acidobacteria bacterium]|nr:VOC family protein [Acidobacteriota bacterium]